jgi:hypothetical protein
VGVGPPWQRHFFGVKSTIFHDCFLLDPTRLTASSIETPGRHGKRRVGINLQFAPENP